MYLVQNRLNEYSFVMYYSTKVPEVFSIWDERMLAWSGIKPQTPTLDLISQTVPKP